MDATGKGVIELNINLNRNLSNAVVIIVASSAR